MEEAGLWVMSAEKYTQIYFFKYTPVGIRVNQNKQAYRETTFRCHDKTIEHTPFTNESQVIQLEALK